MSTMTFIDTHTHLFSDKFKEDIDKVVDRALDAGIESFILPNIDLQSIPKMHQLCDAYPTHMFPAMGLHPCYVKEDYTSQLQIIEAHLRKKTYPYVAVGEIGIDLYWDTSTLAIQQDAFAYQVELAKTLRLPIIIHVRDAFNEVFEILDQINDDNLKGVFHCFTGTLDQAKKILSYNGFKLGIGGVLTYKNSALKEVVKHIDLSHIILETDSPYLAPKPFRGKRNESAYLVHVAETLSEITKKKRSEISNITSENAKALFF